MKGAPVWIKYLSVNAFALGILMAAFGIYNSWSEHALTSEAPLLNLTLGLICFTFLIRSFTHPERERVLFTISGMKYRVSQSNRTSWWLFFGVMVFPVTHPETWVQNLHLIFTGAAIASAYIEVVYWHEKGPEFWGAMAGLLFGLFGFLMAFMFHTYSISIGEVIASLPITIHILATNTKEIWKSSNISA